MEMAHDDDKPEAGDDPWAGLEAESQADAEPDFSFSFDDDATADVAASAEPLAEHLVVEEPLFTDPLAEERHASGAVADEIAFGEPDAALDALLDDGLEAAPDAALDSLLAAEAPLEDDAAEPDVIPAADAFAAAATESAADADIDDWLNGATDAEASASSVLAAGVFEEPGQEADGFPDFAAGESTVSIGTGTSGIASPSGIEALGESTEMGESEPASAGDDLDPFAGLSTDEGGWPTAEDGEAVADFGAGFDAGAGAAAAGAAAGPASLRRNSSSNKTVSRKNHGGPLTAQIRPPRLCTPLVPSDTYSDFPSRLPPPDLMYDLPMDVSRSSLFELESGMCMSRGDARAPSHSIAWRRHGEPPTRPTGAHEG
jgi:hypothetical protein